MATTLVPTQLPTNTPLVPLALPVLTAGDVTGMNVNNYVGNIFLLVSNSAAAVGTITLAVPPKFAGHTVTADTISVPASVTNQVIGPFPASVYGPTMSLTPSATTLSLAAVQVVAQ